MTIPEFTSLDDISVLHCFKLWASADDVPLANLCRGLLYRKVFKTIDLTHLAPAPDGVAPEDAAARRALAAVEAAVTRAGGDSAYDLFYDEPTDAPYEGFGHRPEGEPEIMVQRPDGRLTPFGEVSPLTLALSKQLMFRRLHVAAAWRQVAEDAVGQP